jgi:multiple sugar transport system ATP-binding protein
VNIDLAEMMGSEVCLYSNVQGSKIVAKVPSRRGTKEGDTIPLVVDCRKIHLFDKETEAVICT